MFKTTDITVTDFQQFFLPSLRTSTAGYVGYVSQQHEALIQWQINVGPLSAVLAQHYANSAQHQANLGPKYLA